MLRLKSWANFVVGVPLSVLGLVLYSAAADGPGPYSNAALCGQIVGLVGAMCLVIWLFGVNHAHAIRRAMRQGPWHVVNFRKLPAGGCEFWTDGDEPTRALVRTTKWNWKAMAPASSGILWAAGDLEGRGMAIASPGGARLAMASAIDARRLTKWFYEREAKAETRAANRQLRRRERRGTR
jgi:hypothetical protein